MIYIVEKPGKTMLKEQMFQLPIPSVVGKIIQSTLLVFSFCAQEKTCTNTLSGSIRFSTHIITLSIKWSSVLQVDRVISALTSD